jgi:hydrogenase/urease accessory protein HupE
MRAPPTRRSDDDVLLSHCWLALIVAMNAPPAFAHGAEGGIGGFLGGRAHPVFGPGHVIAMAFAIFHCGAHASRQAA